MSTSATTNLALVKENADEPIRTHRVHTNVNLDTLDLAIQALREAKAGYDKQMENLVALLGNIGTDAQGNPLVTAAQARAALDAAQSNGATGTLKAAEDGIADLAGSLAATDVSPATANHALGSHFMLGNELRRATSAIAAGEAISSSNTAADTLQGQIDTLRDSVSPSDKIFRVKDVTVSGSFGTSIFENVLNSISETKFVIQLGLIDCSGYHAYVAYKYPNTFNYGSILVHDVWGNLYLANIENGVYRAKKIATTT